MPSRGPLLVAALAVIALVALLAASYSFYPVPFQVGGRLLLLVALLALLSAAFVGWGSLPSRLFGGSERNDLVVAWGLGAALTATLMAWSSTFYFPTGLVTSPFLAAGVLLLLGQRQRIRWSPLRPSPFELGVCLLFLLPPLLLALAPPTSLDSLVYHLAIPRQAQLEGLLAHMPWHHHSYFPLHAEMLFGLAIDLADGSLAQLLHLLTALLTLVVVARVGREELGERAGAWAAVLLLTIPVLDLVAGWAWNDWFVLLFFALALEQHLRFRRQGDAGAYRLMAVFVGAAVATKYYALPLLALLVPWRRVPFRVLAEAGALLLAVGAPWYFRNLLLTGNPVYPLLSANPAARALSHYRGELSWSSVSGYLGRADLADESIGLLLLGALPLALLLVSRKTRVPPSLAIVAAGYVLAGFFVQPTVRSFSPLLLLLALAGGGGVARVLRSPHGRWLVPAVASCLLFVNLAHVLLVIDRYRPVGVVFGLVSPTTYLEQGQPYLRAFEWLGDHAGEEDRVLVVGESRAFYLRRPAIWGSFLDPHPIASFADEGLDVEPTFRRLRDEGVRFIYLDPSQYRVGERPVGLTDELAFYVRPEMDTLFKELLEQHASPVFHQGTTWVFALDETGFAPSPP